MEYCNDCGQPMNGFNYGFGFKYQCSKCHQEEIQMSLLKKKTELEIKILSERAEEKPTSDNQETKALSIQSVSNSL